MNTDITWWISQLGFPGVLCFMAWRVLVFLKPIILDLIPYVKEIFTGHVRLMETLETHAKTGSERLLNVEQTQRAQGIQLTEIHTRVHQK